MPSSAGIRTKLFNLSVQSAYLAVTDKNCECDNNNKIFLSKHTCNIYSHIYDIILNIY